MKKIIAGVVVGVVLSIGLVGTANAKPTQKEAALAAFLSTSFKAIKDVCLENSDDPEACYDKHSKAFIEHLKVELVKAAK